MCQSNLHFLSIFKLIEVPWTHILLIFWECADAQPGTLKKPLRAADNARWSSSCYDAKSIDELCSVMFTNVCMITQYCSEQT